MNTFTKRIFIKITKSILEKIPNGEFLFEIQNSVDFENLYLENKKYVSLYKDTKVVSWNEIIEINNESCKKIIMEYYSPDDVFLNRTVDYLYSHDRNWYKFDKFFIDYNITEFNWNIRNSNQIHSAHIYYLIRGKYD